MNEVLLKASGIFKSFGDPRRPAQLFWQKVLGRQSPPAWHSVLSGVDLEIRRGETVGILGQNGAGKSTLLAILAGARNATSGLVERYGRIVPILELGGSFDTNRSGRANVYEMARSYGIASRAVDRVVAEAEEFADIGEAFEQPLRTLSSGMRARVAFGAAMAIDADLVMLDETLAVGDLSFRLRCYDLIRRRQNEGTSFLLVGHNPNTLANLCSRLIVLNDRNIVFDGDPATAILVYKAIRIGRWKIGDHSDPVTIAVEGATHIERNIGDVVEIVVAVSTTVSLRNVFLNLGFINANGVTLSATSTANQQLDTLAAGSSTSFRLRFNVLLSPGKYRLVGALNIDGGEEVESVAYNAGLLHLSVRGEPSHKGIASLQFEIQTAAAAAKDSATA